MSYWQLRCAEMKQRSAYLFQSGLWSDCSFKVGEEEVIVKAHRLIVAMASPVFGKLFYGTEAAKNPVPIYDTRPEVFRILLEYIYSDHINLTNLRDACDLHNAAFKWRIPYVKDMCIKFISSSLNADNAICIYELACQSKEFHLQDDCIKIFKTLTKEILKAESLKEAKLSTVLKIFSMETLNIDSELDLFKAAVNHAAAQEVENEGLKRTQDRSEDCFIPADGPSSAKRSRIDSTGLDNAVETETNNDTTSDSAPAVNASTETFRNESHYVAEHDYAGESPRENDMTTESYIDYEEKLLKAKTKATRREKYRDLMRKIRFLTLTPQEFAECTTLPFLLPTSAIMALSLNISAKDTFVPMPKHFSTSMVPRNLSQQNEREKQAGTTRITVNNIRNLKKFESYPFYIRNLAWTLMLLHLQETVEDVNRDILIVAVTCFFEKGVLEWIEKVEVKVSFISEYYIGNRFQDMKLKLSQPCNEYGAWIIKTEWSDLMSAHGIIEDNTVTCKVYVSTNIQKSPTSPDSTPDNTQTDFITTPLRSSTPVSRARYLKEKTKKQSDLTAPGLAETRSLTPRLPEKRSLTPLLPEKRSLTPLLPEKRSLTPLLPEKRSLTPLLSEKCNVPSPVIEKRSLTPLLPEKRSVTPSPLTEKRSLTPQLPEKSKQSVLSDRCLTPPNKRLPPVLPEKCSRSPLIEKHGVAKTPGKRNLSPLPEERNITPPPVANTLPPRPKKPYLTQSPTEKLAGFHEKSSLNSSPLETSNLPTKNGANSSPLPSNNKTTPSVPEKHVSQPTPLPINTKSPISSQATVTQSISSPSLSAVAMRPKQTGNTVRSPQTPNSPVVGPINLNSSDPSIETLKLSVSNKDKPRALTCVQILRSLHRKGYPMNGSIAQRYLNELSAMSINGFQVLRPLLAYANASAATNGSGHIVPAIMDKKRDIVSPMNSANSSSSMTDTNSKSVTKPFKPYKKESEPVISEPIPKKHTGSSVSEPYTLTDVVKVLANPSALMGGADSIKEKDMKQQAPKSLTLKDNEPLISEAMPIKDNVSSVPMALTDDVKVTSNPSALTDCTDPINPKNVKQLTPKHLALKDDGPSISEPTPVKDNVSSVSEPIALIDDNKAMCRPSAQTDCNDSISENTKQFLPKPVTPKDDGPSISEPIPKKDNVSTLSVPMAITEDVEVISKKSPLMDDADSTKEKDMKQLASKQHGPKDNEPSISPIPIIPIEDTISSISEPMAITDNITAIHHPSSNPSALTDCTDSINEKNMKQHEPIPMEDTISSISEPMAITDNITAISNPSALTDCTDSINENNMKQHEPIPIRDTNSSVSEPMAITDDITGISSPPTLIDCTDSSNEQNIKHLASIPHTPKDNEPSISEPISIKDSSVIETLTTTDDLNSAFKPSIIAASSISDPLPLKSLALEHSKVSIEDTKTEQVHPKSPVTVISEPRHLNDGVSLSENMALNDDFEVPCEPSAITKFTDSANEKDMEQLAPNPLPLMDNEPLILEPMCLEEPEDTNAISEQSSIKIAPKVPVKLEAESSIIDRTHTILEQSTDDKNKEQTTLKTLALRAIPLVLDSNIKENTFPTVPQSLDSSVNDESLLMLTASNNNSSSMSDSRSLKYDDSESELFDLIDRADSSLKRDSIESPLDVKKDAASCNSKPFAGDNISPTPMDLMESVDIHPEPRTVEAKLTLDDTEPMKSEPVALNDTILLNSKPVAVPLVSNPLVLGDNLTSTPKQMDLMEIFDTISELHTLEAKLTLGDTEPLKSEPLALNDTMEPRPAAVPLVSDPLVLNDNLSSASKPMDVMEIFDTISELHTLEAQQALGDSEPSKSGSLALNDTILSDSKAVAVPLVSKPLVLDDNLTSASKPMDLMEIFDTISELHTLEAKLTLGDNEPSKSEPVALNDTILLEPKPAAVPLVSGSLVPNHNLSSTSEPMDLMEVFDTISELRTLEAHLTPSDTELSKSEPLALNDTILSDSKAGAVPLVSKPLVLDDNLSSASKPMDLMEIFDTISELHTLKAQLTLSETVSCTAPNDTIPLETDPVAVKDKVTKVSVANALTLSVSDPLALSDSIPSVSNTLALNDNISSAAKPIYLKDNVDTNPESHSVDSRLTFGDTEPLKSDPLPPIHTIPSEAKTVVLKDNGTTLSKPLVLKDDAATLSKPFVFIENVPSALDSSVSNANSASEPMDITDSNIKPLTTEVLLIQSDIPRMIPETIERKENSRSVSKDMALPSNSGITSMSAFNDKDSSLSSEAILKCRRTLMTLKQLKYPMSGTLAQKYLKTLKELTDKSGTNVTTNLDPKSKPSTLKSKASMSEEAKVDESKQTLILINRQILMSLKFLKYPMSGPIAQKHMKALLDLTNKTQQPHLKSTEISHLAPRSKESSAASSMSEMKKAFIIRKIRKYKRALMTLKFHKYPMTGFMALKYIKAIDDLKRKIDL